MLLNFLQANTKANVRISSLKLIHVSARSGYSVYSSCDSAIIFKLNNQSICFEILAGKKNHEYREIRPTNAKKYITYLCSGKEYKADEECPFGQLNILRPDTHKQYRHHFRL